MLWGTWLRIIALTVVVSIFGRGQAATAEEKGKVILTIGADRSTTFTSCLFFLQSKDRAQTDNARYEQSNWLLGSNRDFDDVGGNGVVKILELPPGAWEINNMLITGFTNGHPKALFSVPFSVKAGRTIYIGQYQAHSVADRDENGKPAQSIYFVLSDQSWRDIPIARKKDSTITDVSVEIPDVSAGGPIRR